MNSLHSDLGVASFWQAALYPGGYCLLILNILSQFTLMTVHGFPFCGCIADLKAFFLSFSTFSTHVCQIVHKVIYMVAISQFTGKLHAIN